MRANNQDSSTFIILLGSGGNSEAVVSDANLFSLHDAYTNPEVYTPN